MGRLLITFWLCEQKILSQPLLYLSYYFKKNRTEYYDRLMRVRFEGEWEEWIKFFLKGVAEVSDEATTSAKNIIELKNTISSFLSKEKSGANEQLLLDMIFKNPFVTRTAIIDELEISSPTAGDLLERFCKYGILRDLTPEKQRGKKYLFKEYYDILEPGTK